jgi:nitrogen regulatory protein P-II 1
MQKIEAIIRPFKLDEVKGILAAMGISGAAVTEVKVQGKQKGHREAQREAAYSPDFYPMMRLEVVVTDEQKDEALASILRITRTGGLGDGKIFVSPLDEAIRIRNEESGVNAVCPATLNS